MLDIRYIREHPEEVQEKAKQKGYDPDKVERLLEVDKYRKDITLKSEELRRTINAASEEFKTRKPNETEKADVRHFRELLKQDEKELKDYENEYQELIREIPNIFPDSPDTPLGGEEANREEKKWGKAEAKDVKDHLAWAEERGLLDFERGAKVAGNKFYFVKGALVELEFAVLQLGLKLAKEAGFEPMLVPHLVKSNVIDGAGFTAKSAD